MGNSYTSLQVDEACGMTAGSHGVCEGADGVSTVAVNNNAAAVEGARTEVVTLERMGYGPEAVGRLADGKTVFVAGGAPGDVAVVEVTEEKRSYARGRMVELKQASPDRVSSFCVYANACGGCPWQHLSYDTQLVSKRYNVVSALARTGGFDKAEAERLVAPCLSSKRQVGYRNKLELAVGTAKNGAFAFGFSAHGTHDVFTPDSCPIAVRHIQRAPKALQGALRFLQGNRDLGIFRVGVRGSVRTNEVEVALWTRPGVFPRAQAAKVLGSAVRATSVVRVLADPGRARKVKGVEVLAGKGHWAEVMKDTRFFTSAPSFFQVNTAQAERLVDCVLEGLGGVKGLLVADLYAGGGTFSVPLARAGADVIAVESAGSSVRDLRHNAEVNDADIDVIGGDAARELPQLGGLDALVVDPPRAGLADGVVESIALARPSRVAYVSCDVATWARDVARFERAGYRLVSVQPVDMFPQTYHVETVSIFHRL
ncbi:23S rRNA (uracil(1939)-C(5))-methyltransferase RlmD [Adlercreutzia sp. ZJ138]|uniref:23S rRNA (uracil(1939)-C(5))-methyltransferase RlmD n=1 Tax=Adlercreutzia sp. ZJ138 TaxID=2709405 RepID=UPI001F14A62C|nr:23S rRNA (uracil(1939)-C(5))-methyltransferase RlmD [Adlercreutzia sp. ZJ138]